MAQNQIDLTVSIDSDLKASAEAFFRNYGFTMSTGINALIKNAVEHGEMPIGESDDEIWNPAKIRQASADLRAGRIEATDWEIVKARVNALQT
jgi:addiction module RelB/DinJ family antitoxin